MSQKSLIGLVALLFGAGAVWYLWREGCPPLADNVAAMRDEAIQLQQKGEDDAALKKWMEFQSQLPAGACFADERRAAELSVDEIKTRSNGLVSMTTVKPIPSDFKPPEGEVERAAKFYQKGRRVRSLAMLRTTGEGVFSDWGFKSSRHFAYLHQVPLDTRVVKNDNGREIVFEQAIGDVAELMAVCKEELQLDLPQSPLLESLTHEVDQRVAPYLWQYRVVRDLATVLIKLDPDLKRTLTDFQKLLRQSGVPLSNGADVTYVARIKDLAGSRVRVEYVVGLGVTQIDVLDGKKFPKETLLRFAHDANVGADFVLEKKENDAKNEEFEIPIDQLGSSLLAWDGEVSGKLKLMKTAPADGADPNVDQLEIIGGQLLLTDKSGTSGAVTPKPGSYLKYDRQNHLVTEAEVDWSAGSAWKSGDHLFFHATSLHGIQAKSSYRAVSIAEGKE
jgi:hypothetical protein